MNKFIKEQLLKVNELLPQWDDNTRTIVISKETNIGHKKEVDIMVGGEYKFYLENYITNPPPTFSLASNWNNNTVPPENVLNVVVTQIMGKMIKVDAVGETTKIKWQGWLPRKGFKV